MTLLGTINIFGYDVPTVGGPYVWASVGFVTCMHIFEQWLEYRQLKNNRVTERPLNLEGIVNQEDFASSQVYQADRREFGIFKSNIHYVWGKIGLFFTMPFVWKICSDVLGAENEVKVTLAYLFVNSWIDKPLDLICSYYSNFVIEAKHGFNKMTLKTFVTDLVKGELISYVFGGMLIPLLIYIVRSFGDKFYIYLWGTVQILIFVMMWIYPNLIQPMFNKFEVLKDEELRTKIEEMAKTEEFPLTKLFQIDGSTRSKHSNAYFFGFWKWKRIVLYDTLLDLKHDDILAILCHELGHWKFNHTTYMLMISSVHIYVIFWLFGTVMFSGDFSKHLLAQFGYAGVDSVIVSLTIFSSLLEPTEQVMRLLMTMFSRRNEYQADSFAFLKGRGDDLINGLIKIQNDNKGEMYPDPWYSFYHYSHPHVTERISAIKQAQSSTDAKKKE